MTKRRLLLLIVLVLGLATAAYAQFVTSITALPGSTGLTVTITYTTAAQSDTGVNYGTTTSYGTSTPTTDTSPMVTSHTVSIAGLSPSTVYHYQIIGHDSVASTVTTADLMFTTNALGVTSIVVTPATGQVVVGGTRQFTAQATYADGTNGDVTSQCTWSSSNTAVASINTFTGLATGASAGTTTISCAFRGVTGTASLTVTSTGTNYSLWTTQTPTVGDQGVDNPATFAVLFTSDVAGTVTAVKYWRSAANTGSHLVQVWDRGGSANCTVLASATDPDTTSVGWHTVTLATPATIVANHPYNVSYFSSVGHEARDVGYFSSAGWNNGPLHVPTKGDRYYYAANPTCPYNTATDGSNFWVDLVLNTTAPPAPAHKVVLNWTASANASTYKAYRASGSVCSSGTFSVMQSGIMTTSWTDTTVTAGSTYSYVVTALNIYGESPHSNCMVATVPTP